MESDVPPQFEQCDRPLTSLELLQTKLGDDAHLLDYLPTNDVYIVSQTELPDHIPYKIKIRTGPPKTNGVRPSI
jgi:hypothetical protein